MKKNNIELMKEEEIMNDIDNENIVRIYGVVMDKNEIMIVNELENIS
jgi:serine/threonine protein kinase